MQRMNFPSMSAKKGSLSSNFNNPDPRLRLSCLHSELDVSLLKWCQCILQLHTLLRSFVEIQLDDLTSLRSVSLSSPCCDAEEGRKRVRDEDIQTYGIEALSEVVAKRKELIEMVERGITMSSEEERETKLEYIRQQLIVCAETSETLFDTEIDNTYDDEHRDFASFVEEQQESTMNEFGGLMLFPNQHRHSPFFPRSDREDVHRESSEETKCDNLASSLYRERNNNEDYTYELENDGKNYYRYLTLLRIDNAFCFTLLIRSILHE